MFLPLCVLSCFSCVQLFLMLWTIAHQAPLFMGFSRQEHWSELPCPSPGDLPAQGSNLCPLCLLHWQAGSLPVVPPKDRDKVITQEYVWVYVHVCLSQVALLVNTPPVHAENTRDTGSIPWVRKIPWSSKWHPTPVFLPRKFHGQKSLAGYSP